MPQHIKPRKSNDFRGFCYLAKLAFDIFNSSCKLLFADERHDVCDAQSV